MNIKEAVLSIVIYAFLGYLWVIFVKHINSIANSMNHISGGLILFVGALLFWMTVNRISPFNTYKQTHPAKVIGAITFIAIVLIQVYVYNLV
ncbi:hypothetical protein ABN764_07455 [Paenibacillaceae sp. P-4]|uniref:Uncharacterized protein n=1 Tax=Paenibacillus suaedae TaxID=3077233 RepID=A0AAJ2JXV1_9BACL|nr:hypothetical protein [Paenibacillus sp. chi10]MDT8978461.1 hypothetical protein [Paenibacillus sp. chi10]